MDMAIKRLIKVISKGFSIVSPPAPLGSQLADAVAALLARFYCIKRQATQATIFLFPLMIVNYGQRRHYVLGREPDPVNSWNNFAPVYKNASTLL